MRYLLFCIFILGSNLLYGQCTIQGQRQACINDLVGFSITVTPNTPASWSWDFQAYGTSVNVSPLVKFTAAGTVIITCTVTLTNGSKCSDTHAIKILKSPIAGMANAPTTDSCFKTNKICINDYTQVATRGIASINLLWGDGNISQYKQPIASTWCHTYLDTGSFKLNMEVADSAGCKSVASLYVQVVPSTLITISDTKTQLCDSVKICINQNTIGGKKISSVIYQMPGNKKLALSAPFCKTLQPYDSIYYKIVAKNEFGCADSSFYNYKAPASYFYVKKIKDSICNNFLTGAGSLNFTAGEPVQWELNGKTVYKGLNFVANSTAKFGKNYVKAYRTGACTGMILDSFYVVGVQAKAAIYNYNEFNVNDTVFLRDMTGSTNPGRVLHIWDFGDNTAPQCTTWTAKGWNVDKNCNFSMDSIGRHKYPDSLCVAARLILYDSNTDCFDDTLVPIFRRKFCPDFVVSQAVCDGDFVIFTVPSNVKQKVGDNNFLIVDTVKGSDTIILFNGSGKYKYKKPGIKSPIFWRYYPQDTIWTLVDGKIVVNFIRPARGWVADTLKGAVVVSTKPNALFKIVKSSECDPYEATLKFQDTIFRDPKFLIIDWSDTTITFSNFTDSIFKIPELKHIYKTGGTYTITVRMLSKSNCVDFTVGTVSFSHHAKMVIGDLCSPEICFYDTVTDIGTQQIWKKGNNYGNVYWDFGDGVKDSGFGVCHKYKNSGKFIITAHATSAKGCVVTVVDSIFLNPPIASIKHQPLIYCSEIRQYFDSSYIPPPFNGAVINYWKWDFGDGTAPVFVKNPAHIYASGGVYTATLVVKTDMGCTDTTTMLFPVIGPQVGGEIISDSIGCAPLKVDFSNLSKNTGNFIWEYGDPDRNFYSTNKDTVVTFTYKKPGIYFIHIIGGDSFYNPTTGSQYYCSVRYPSSTQKQLRVQVLPTAYSSFNTTESVCLGDSFLLENTSDTGVKYLWDFGNGDSAIRVVDTFYYTYKDTGAYWIKLSPIFGSDTNSLCVSHATKKVNVIKFYPKFELDCKRSNGPEIYLTNLSAETFPDYYWSRVDPLDSSSTLLGRTRDLQFNFGNDTGKVIICLGLENIVACGGSKCETFVIQGDIALANVFTPNKDGFNDYYRVPAYGYSDFDLKIYNRWGELIFHSKKPENMWNGRLDIYGPDLPEGTYFYQFIYSKLCDRKKHLVCGSINLIR